MSQDPTPNPNYLVKAVAMGAKLRAVAVCSTAVGQTLRDLHDASPTAAAALTRVATACLLMGGLQKGREQVGLQLRGDGLLGQVMAIADAKGHVRALVDQPEVDFPPRDDGRFDVGFVVGLGELVVTRSINDEAPYQGIVPLVSGEIGDDLAHYFLTSEQKRTAVGLAEWIEGGQVRAAGGFLIQGFPDATEDDLAAAEACILAMPSLSELLKQGMCPEDILRAILPEVEILGGYPVELTCTCARERYERILISLGRDELQSLRDEQGQADLQCQFCRSTYTFTSEDLRLLIIEASAPPAPNGARRN
jgi:molecular chaperone Hsp33